MIVARQGRGKRHYLNPRPLRELYSRWIGKFDEPRLEAQEGLKARLE